MLMKSEAYVPGDCWPVPEPEEIIVPDYGRVRKASTLARRFLKTGVVPNGADLAHFRKLKALFKASRCKFASYDLGNLRAFVKRMQRWE